MALVKGEILNTILSELCGNLKGGTESGEIRCREGVSPIETHRNKHRNTDSVGNQISTSLDR